MRLRNPSLVAACCLLPVLPAKADVIVMKNGDKLEGTVLREDGDSYVVEVKVTATIRDEKIIPRAEVERIEKEPEDVKAFAEIADLCPAPELLSEEGYAERIKKLEGFLNDHPASSKAEKAKEMIKTLQEELAVIAGGGIKFGEGIIAPEEFEANAYEYDARIAEKRIRDAVSRRDLLGALRRFDTYEKDFGEPEGRADLAELMLQVLASYRESIAENLASLDDRLKAREAGLERMTPENRANSERALRQQDEDNTKRFEEEKAARVKWVTPHAFHKESLDEAQRQVTTEQARLWKLTPAPEVPLAEVYRSAWEKLLGGTDEEKKAVLDAAKAKKLPETYLAKLRERAGLPEQ